MQADDAAARASSPVLPATVSDTAAAMPGAPAEDPGPGHAHRALRSALGHFATGVTVVSAVDEGGQWLGLTVNSFNALSLDPPLVLWSLRRESPSAQAFEPGRRFAVNVLGEQQLDVSRRFASRAKDRFAAGDWRLGVHGAPLLAGAAAVFECELQSRQVAGDHWLFIGRVLACHEQAVAPLVYQGGQYRRLGPAL
jgi:4-hydroxyphenylacetate 3-hydroxylase, reductase component